MKTVTDKLNVNTGSPMTFSVNIFSEQVNDWSENFTTVQDVIDYIVEQIKHQDDSSWFLDATIRVFSETETCFQLIANKTCSYSIQDFIVDLAQISNDANEAEIKDALSWLHVLEKYLPANKFVEEI